MFDLGNSWRGETHAKINLGLKVLRRRDDGYHELVTLMHEIDLHDHLEVRSSEEDRLSCSDDGVPLGSDNLLFRALEKVRARGHQIPRLSMHLDKKIPMGGGLGGGSSNAVGLLLFLAETASIGESELDEIAAELGSDTNFFLKGGTSLCRGRGEIIEPMGHQDWFFNLVFPPWSCSTPRVFQELKDDEIGENPNIQEAWAQGKEYGSNDLMDPCLRAYPEMKKLFDGAREREVALHLSGSGSTCFTLHDSENERDSVYKTLGKVGSVSQVVKARSHRR